VGTISICSTCVVNLHTVTKPVLQMCKIHLAKGSPHHLLDTVLRCTVCGRTLYILQVPFILQLRQTKEAEVEILRNIPMGRYVLNSDGSLMCV
jgi:hypothetical protein